MPTIQVETSFKQLLDAVAQLPPEELNAFTEEVVALRANRTAPHVAEDEASLLLQINRGLSADLQTRSAELVARRQQEVITASEQAELIRLSNWIEQLEAERIAALAKLAYLRNVSVRELMASLGIPPPAYAD
jgi:hypothetical protein